MKIGYARVSTREQNPDLQLDALKRAGCERIFQDVASGSKTARPALDDMLSQLRAGDVLVIWKLDRMGRSLKHLVELVGDLVKRLTDLRAQLVVVDRPGVLSGIPFRAIEAGVTEREWTAALTELRPDEAEARGL